MLPVRFLRRYVKKCLLLVTVFWVLVFVIHFYVDDNSFRNRLVKTYPTENAKSNTDNIDAGINSVVALGSNQHIAKINEGQHILKGEDSDEVEMESEKQLAEPLLQPDGPGMQLSVFYRLISIFYGNRQSDDRLFHYRLFEIIS